MIISVLGPSGAGKSTLAKGLQQIRPELFARVPVDYFFVPREPGRSMADFLAEPFAYDWAAVDRALAEAAADRSSCVVTTPDCDFAAMRWRAASGGLPIPSAPIFVLDGMRPHPRSDRVILLEIDPAEQRRRLVDRDRRWGTSVAERGDHLAATFRLGLAELPRSPDLRLDATAPVEFAIATVIAVLAEPAP